MAAKVVVVEAPRAPDDAKSADETKTVQDDGTKRAIEQAKAYFDNCVFPEAPNKKFSAESVHYVPKPGDWTYIWGSFVKAKDGHLITNCHDGVAIMEYSRVTTYKGDTDTFVDVLVRVDGKTLLQQKH